MASLPGVTVRGCLQVPVPDQLRHAERAAGIARRRLDPEPLERPFAQQPPVADAVERDAAGQAEVLEPGLACARAAPCAA